MTATATYTIKPETLQEWMSAGKAFHLIHTLPGDHYAHARIPGAAHACVYEVTFMDQVYAVTRDKEAPVVVYGDNADTMAATVAAEKLQRAGFVSVHVLTGGLQQWQAQGFDLEGSDADPPEDRGAPAPLTDGTYTLDLESSVIEWTGRNPNTQHHGTLSLSEGRLSVAGATISGDFKIDMHTIRNVNLEGDELQPVLEAHLKSDDFFFVKLFPWARFHLKIAHPADEPTYTLPNYQIGGDLELRGVTAPLAFAANMLQMEDGSITADAHFDFDRTRWGIIYGSSRFFKHLGMHVVYDMISVQLKIKLVPG
jgi:polyisoprenoid-binding protein YceI